MKTCRDCGEMKPLTEYYTHRRMPDGHLNKCKECVKARVRAHRQENIDRIREYDRNRPNKDERRAINRERYRKAVADPKKRKRMWKKSAEWRRQNVEKRQCHIIVGHAIRAGELKAQPCERCGYTVGVHAHHEDYSKPLDVTWLCRLCHGERHREINEERRRRAA